MNDVLNGKSKPINILAVDIKKCFDEMNFQETHNDLWDLMNKSDKFALLSQLDKHCAVKVRTPVGLTEEFILREIIAQGSVNSCLKASVQVDSLGRDCLSDPEGLGLYRYKGVIEVPPLALVDDVISVSECGIQSVESSAIVNTKF